MALAMVISSAYSKSAPTGSPKAILETFMPNGLMSFVKYKLVASPSTDGFRARITSFILSSVNLFKSSLILISSAPIPSRGEIKPCKTWYKPLYSFVFSIAIRSFDSDTTQIVDLSREFDEHISQGLVFEILKQISQVLVLALASIMVFAKFSTSFFDILNKKNAIRCADFGPTEGNF